MSEPRKPRVPLLDRTVPFFRLDADLFAAALVFSVMVTGASVLVILGGSLPAEAVLVIAGTAVAVLAMLESMRRDRADP